MTRMVIAILTLLFTVEISAAGSGRKKPKAVYLADLTWIEAEKFSRRKRSS